MKLCSLEIQNFLIIAKAEIDLRDRGLILLQGVNECDSSADSNGSGKSSVVDALFWCLYGVTARDVSADAVVNEKVGKDCFVKVIMEDEDDLYTVTRYRKDKVNKNALVLEKNGTNITCGTNELTQARIAGIIGCSLEVFSSVVYAGQEKMPNLPGMTDKQLKLIVEEAAGVDKFEKAFAEVSTLARTLDSKVKANSEKIEFFENAISSNLIEIENVKEKDQEGAKLFELKKRERIVALRCKRSEIEGQILTLEKEKDGSVSESENVKMELKDTCKGIEKAKERLSDVRASNKDIELSVKDLERDLLLKESEIARERKLTKELLNAKKDSESIVGTKCSECGKLYEEHDVGEFISLKDQEIKTKAKQLKELINNAQIVEKLLSERVKPLISTDDIEKEITTLSELKSALELRIVKIDSIDSKIKILRDSYAQISDQIGNEEISKFTPSTLFIKDLQKRIGEQRDELVKCQKTDTELKTELETALDAVAVFGKGGIRSHILDTVTPFLNDRTADYLSTLTDGNITAEWTTLVKGAKGDLKEKFGIEVRKEHGSQTFSGLSGGEKRKVRIATALALRDFVATRASKPILFQVFDEIDDSLDISGLERLMSILNKKGREGGTVIVISHNELNTFIPNFLTIVNRDGLSFLQD